MADVVTAPARVDTLREEEKCPFDFGSNDCQLKDGYCNACGYTEPVLDDPDLTKARKFDEQQKQEEAQLERNKENFDRERSKLKRPGRPSFSKAKSKSQFRLMKGICEGNIDHPDITKDVACEFVKNHQSPKGLPEKKDSSYQKHGYWIPGYHAVIFHPTLGFHVAQDEATTHHELTTSQLPPELSDEMNSFLIYGDTYRALYSPATKDLLHMSGPDDFGDMYSRGDIVGAPKADDADSEGWKYFWADLARKNGLDFNRIGMVKMTAKGPRASFGNEEELVPSTFDPDPLPAAQRDYKRPDTYYGNDPTDPNYQVFEFLRNRRAHIADAKKRFAARLAQFNKGEKGMRQSRIRLTAHAELPAADKLEEMGWNLAKKATPDPNDKSERSLAEDGRRASDEPTDTRVVADQKAPVTTKRKNADRVIRREEIIESDDNGDRDESRQREDEDRRDDFHQPNGQGLTTSKKKRSRRRTAEKGLPSIPTAEGGGVVEEQYKSLRKEDATPQFNEDTAPIKEYQPGTQKEQYSDIKKEEETPQFSESTAPIKEHHPDGVVEEQYKGIKKEQVDNPFQDNTKDLGGDKFPSTSVSSSVNVLKALKLAELEQELGLDSTWEAEDKFARIAELENQSVAALDERYAALQNVKEAGLSKPKVRKAQGLPSLTAARSNGGTTASETPDFGDDIVFMR